jgi:hypothetical protein
MADQLKVRNLYVTIFTVMFTRKVAYYIYAVKMLKNFHFIFLRINTSKDEAILMDFLTRKFRICENLEMFNFESIIEDYF